MDISKLAIGGVAIIPLVAGLVEFSKRLNVTGNALLIEAFVLGVVFAAIAGAISLLLAFYSLGVLDAQWGGILLILLAFGLFIGEVLTTTFGIFTAGGIIALVVGSLILFPRWLPRFSV